MPICLCFGEIVGLSKTPAQQITTSSRRYAQIKLQNSLALSLDFNNEVSRFEMATVDMSDIVSESFSRNSAFNGE